MRAVKIIILSAAFVGLTAATVPREYSLCAYRASEAYGDAWTARCRSLGRDRECALSDAEVAPIEQAHVTARLACLDRYRAGFRPLRWDAERKGVLTSILAAPKPERPTVIGWLVSTIAVTVGLAAMLDLLRRPRNG